MNRWCRLGERITNNRVGWEFLEGSGFGGEG